MTVRFCFQAQHLVWLNGRDLRNEPLLKREQLLRKLVPEGSPHLMYVDHVEDGGTKFFKLVCQRDLEGIICKPKLSPYPFTWIKVKNPEYSQAIGRRELFDKFKKAAAILGKRDFCGELLRSSGLLRSHV